MRRGPALLIIAFLCIAVPATAMDLLSGTVTAVDRKTGRLLLRPSDTKILITVVIRPDLLPGFVETGASVKVWGNYVQNDPPIFQAKKITREHSRTQKKDPTGVRSRLIR